MPRLLFSENGAPPSTRSERQLRSAIDAGWDVTVVARPGAVVDLPVEILRTEHEPSHPFAMRRVVRRTRLDQDLAAASERLRRTRARLSAITSAARRLRGTRVISAPLTARATSQRTDLEDRIAALRTQRRVLEQIDATPSPFGVAHHFGDLLRFEGFWTDTAARVAALDWDVAHAADLDALPPLVWAAGAVGRPVLFDAHEVYDLLSYLPPVQAPAWRALTERFIPLADTVVSVSAASADALRDRGARRVEVIENLPLRGGRSTTDLRAAAGVPAGATLAVHSGAAPANRRPERVITALTDAPGLHVAFVGALDDPTASGLRAAASAAGVAERLHVLPPVPLDEVASFLTGADVGLILYGADAGTYASISMPNKLYDYIAAGIPVVAATGTGAASYVASHGAGVVFVPDGNPSLAQAIATAATDPGIRASVRALEPSMDWASAGRRYVELLDQLRAGNA